MVRNYKKKTNKGETSADAFLRAAIDVNSKICSLREAAQKYAIPFSTFQRYFKKETLRQDSHDVPVMTGYAKPGQIFKDCEEIELVEYIENCAKIYFGLSPQDIRKLAYEYADANCKKIPVNWREKRIASSDWFGAFMKRHPKLSIRKPEATSLARATAFNKHNVQCFQDKLATLYERHNFQPHEVWNVDETGITTVQKPSKIVATKGTRQVGAITSAERGVLVTMVFAINALGNSVPPMFIFPRKNYKAHFVNNGPVGSIGAATPSGWVTEREFLMFVKHLAQHVRCDKDHPILLTLDNHSSHLSIPVLEFCKSNGIVLLSFPPHTTHKLQPLDRSVYGPFKKYINNACDSWMKSHPNKTMVIYDIPGIAREALPLAATAKNIQAGFERTGIWPFRTDIFQDSEFLPSYVSDRRMDPNNETELEVLLSSNALIPIEDSTIRDELEKTISNLSQIFVTPPDQDSAIESITVENWTEIEIRNFTDPQSPVASSSRCDSFNNGEATGKSAEQKKTKIKPQTARDTPVVCSGERSKFSTFRRQDAQAANDSFRDSERLLMNTSHGQYARPYAVASTSSHQEEVNRMTSEKNKSHTWNRDSAGSPVASSSRVDHFKDVCISVSPRATKKTLVARSVEHLGSSSYPRQNSHIGTESRRVLRRMQLDTESCQETGSSPAISKFSDRGDANKVSKIRVKPANIFPYPKADDRKDTGRKRKKMKSAILTDSPEMKSLRLAAEERIKKKSATKEKEKPAKLAKIKGTKRKRSSLKLKQTHSVSPDHDECFCIVCDESFTNSKKGDEWVQCLGCHRWAHEHCISGETTFFICEECPNSNQ